MEYVVSIDNEESNEVADVISMTGRVNGIACAARVRISQIKSLKPKDAKILKQKALIEAFVARVEASLASAGERVTV